MQEEEEVSQVEDQVQAMCKNVDPKNEKKMFEPFSVSEPPIDAHDTVLEATMVQVQAQCRDARR